MMHVSVTRIDFWLSIIHLASALFAAPEGPWFSPLGMMHSPGFDGNSSLSLQMLMNADSLYTAAHCALLLNLKLSHGDYYRKRPTLAPGMMVSVCALHSDPLRTSSGLRAGKLSVSALRGRAQGVLFCTALE